MDETKLAAMIGNALGTGAAVAVLLLILWRVLRSIVERWITTLDRVATEVRDHTKVDLEHHAEVKTSIVRLETKFDSQRDWMREVAGEDPPRRQRTNPHGFRPLRGHHDDRDD